VKKAKVLFHANAAAAYVSGLYSGINRVTFELLQAISMEKDLPFEFEIFTQGLKNRKKLLNNFNLKYHHIFTPNNSFFPQIYEYIPIRESFFKYDLFHIPHNFEYCFNPEKCLVTVHDMLMFVRKNDFPISKFIEQSKKLPKLLNASKGIITCSESSKADIEKYLNISPTRIKVIPWGVRHEIFFPREKSAGNNEQLKRLNINYPYFLSVSCGTDRKNTFILIKAFLHFSKQAPKNHLVLVWPKAPPEVRDYIIHNNLGNYIHCIDHVDDRILAILYNEATALLFPSKYEGFGLPVLESLACGTPVIVGNNSSLPEVAGDAGIYINNVDDTKEWEEKMEESENGKLKVPYIINKGIDHAKKFTWNKNANLTMDVYKSLI